MREEQDLPQGTRGEHLQLVKEGIVDPERELGGTQEVGGQAEADLEGGGQKEGSQTGAEYDYE